MSPVLDETTERFWWDTGNYFFLPAANPPKPGGHWYYADARTLPGYPTLTRDHMLRLGARRRRGRSRPTGPPTGMTRCRTACRSHHFRDRRHHAMTWPAYL